MGWKFEPLVAQFDQALDGPVWDGGGVLFCCPLRNEIHRWDEASGGCELVRHPTVRIRGLAFDREGRLFGAQSRARRVVWLSDEGGTYYLDAMLDGRRHNDPQDLVTDRAGRVWFTDRYTEDSIPGPVGYPPLEHQSVLRLTEHNRPGDGGLGDWTVERMTFDTSAPSGIALSPDERTLYVVDGEGTTGNPRRLKAYRVTTSGVLGRPRMLHEFGPDEQAAGACTDSRGNVVVAVTGDKETGGLLVVVAPDGSVRHEAALPDSPTNCCFGGADGDTLFVTTRGGRLYAATGG